MKYSVDKQERYTIFTLHEENLNSVIAPNLKSEFVILSNEGIASIILDLENVKFVDSSGLSAILTANRIWNTGHLVLTNLTPNVKKLITISRLDSILSITPTLEVAIESLNSKEEEVIEEEESEEEEAAKGENATEK
jgi:anti-anti-sigma factor